MDQPKQTKTDRTYYLFASKIVGDFGVTIAIPVVLFVLIGKHFDTKWGTAPLCIILGFIIAALLSGRMIYKKAKRYGQDYQKLK